MFTGRTIKELEEEVSFDPIPSENKFQSVPLQTDGKWWGLFPQNWKDGEGEVTLAIDGRECKGWTCNRYYILCVWNGVGYQFVKPLSWVDGADLCSTLYTFRRPIHLSVGVMRMNWGFWWLFHDSSLVDNTIRTDTTLFSVTEISYDRHGHFASETILSTVRDIQTNSYRKTVVNRNRNCEHHEKCNDYASPTHISSEGRKRWFKLDWSDTLVVVFRACRFSFSTCLLSKARLLLSSLRIASEKGNAQLEQYKDQR